MTDPSSSAANDDEWCTVESDPAVFTEMLALLGCETVELDELYSLEDDALEALQASTKAVYGLIFLFQWDKTKQQAHAASKQPLAADAIPETLFFAHQVTTNSCATQAVLSILFNAVSNQTLTEDDLGATLAEFRTVAATFPPELAGVAIQSSNEIKTAHNSFSKQDSFLQEGKVYDATTKGEAFHFVAYVPHHDSSTVYELDGLQTGPMVAGEYTTTTTTTENNNNKDWLKVARQAIQDRMQSIGADSGAVKFNLMAVIQDKRVQLQDAINAAAADDTDKAEQLQLQLQHEQAKREQWKLENQRRRHNYVPLAVQLLKELARHGQLPGLIEAAQEKARQKKRDAAAANNNNKSKG